MAAFISGVSVFVGDSITLGFSASINWPDVITAAKSLTQHNVAHGSEGWIYNAAGQASASNLSTRAAADVDIYVGSDPLLFLFAGTNDLSRNTDPAATWAAMQVYIAARVAAGLNVHRMIVNTLTDRIDGGLNPYIATLNALIVAGAATLGYQLARLDLNANIGAGADTSNTTYFTDGLHLANAGQNIVATINGAVAMQRTTMKWGA